MDEIAWGCLLFAGLATLLHVVSAALAAYRARRGRTADLPFSKLDASQLPPVSILRPVRGVDPYDELTLKSGFELAYERYELIFCCDDADDPVVPLIRGLIARHPGVDAHLVIGHDYLTSNPKLNNLIKGWRVAKHPWVVMADSNVLMPADYLQRLLATWRADTGLVCAPPIGCLPANFWAEVECAFLNTFQARWQYAADSVGLGFAQGKTMLWRRSDLERAGGISALGAEIAEDAAATKVVRSTGKRVRLVDGSFGQPLGMRTAAQIWSRQVRWAKLRRATFPLYFLPEIFTGSLPPLVAAVVACEIIGAPSAIVAAALVSGWYASELALARIAGWHVGLASPLAWIARDALLPAVWVHAWLGNSFSWRGNDMHLADAMASN
jgi:ceramide glucosyltransferase